MGNLLAIKVHAANRHDGPSGAKVVDTAIKNYSSLETICGDSAYNGTTTLHVINHHQRQMMISKKIKDQSVSPKRWIVERTFAWLGWYRRLNIDYEKLTLFAENMVRITMIALGIRKLRRF